MSRKFPRSQFPQLEFQLGDVRDLDRCREAFHEVDIVVHAAALKQVDTSERNPLEFIKTNVLGAAHVIQAAQEKKVKKIIALSSDKAVNPNSLYGASKLCAEKLFLQAAESRLSGDSIFALVRYGNVLATRGSVIPHFLVERKNKVLSITHPQMTRFSVPIGVESATVIFAIEYSQGGEIFIPKSPSYRISDVAKAVCPDCVQKVIGLRPGEKLKEDLIDQTEIARTFDLGSMYVIFSSDEGKKTDHLKDLQKVPDDFEYASDNNPDWLSIEDIRTQIDIYLENPDLSEF